jgi:hypothetical protein
MSCGSTEGPESIAVPFPGEGEVSRIETRPIVAAREAIWLERETKNC